MAYRRFMALFKVAGTIVMMPSKLKPWLRPTTFVLTNTKLSLASRTEVSSCT